MIKTFQLNALKIDIDTDDYILNAQLIPVFMWVNNDVIQLKVNYEGKLRLYLLINNRLINMLPVVIKYFLNK